MPASHSLPLALTCGDPAGVGPEIIAGWLRANPAEAANVVPIGPRKWLETLGVAGKVVGQELGEPGKPTVEGAAMALAALETAAIGCRAGEFSAVITGPVSKSWMQKAGFTFPGQTEFFAARWSGAPTMAFAGGKLRIVLATWHIPLMEVASALDEVCLMRAVTQADHLARKLGAKSPRIAVCGLNPHAGEDGILGTDERDRIDPWLDKLRARFPGLSRCEPGDTVFWRQLRGEFDVVVALYHDQGLAPLKTVDFDESVNITLGLPWVRTSPDHGTAFRIAGQGKASWKSFGNAVALARRLASTG
ncbi:MAG TPA: 4-hydroxythreonine-4-phosphate dehydrogenase PdxA [Opitutales bacterium]|jgi:4-hydroxythreonine-4-phosphate dehydrogenase|nr:4-hydroxythreonine-4-phosphate dehydrogenase PdxA [Opitutales bacterium]